MIADGLTDAEAEDRLVTLAGHVPAEVVIGRPLVARPDEDAVTIITTDPLSVWQVRDDGAERLLPLAESCELTRYRAGRELSREIICPSG